jgi:hypothetical protein
MDGAAIKAACKEIEVREEALQRVLAICANPPWCADAGGRKNLEAVKAALEGATHD